MKKQIILGLAGLVAFCYGVAETAAPALTDPHKPIVLEAHQPELVLRLNANATTGYSWLLKHYPRDLLTLEGHRYLAPAPSKMVGVGGIDEWHFKILPAFFLAPQLSEITLIYARPWEIPTQQPTTITIVSQ